MWTRGASLPPVARLSVKLLQRQTLCTKTRVQAYQENKSALPYFSPTRNLSLSTTCWKGHNKWSNIKHIKGARDAEIAKKNLLFRNRIVLAIKQNGNNSNIDSNYVLRKVLEEAKSQMVSFESPWLKMIKMIPSGAKGIHWQGCQRCKGWEGRLGYSDYVGGERTW